MGIKANASPSETHRPRQPHSARRQNNNNARTDGDLNAYEPPWVRDRQAHDQKKQRMNRFRQQTALSTRRGSDRSLDDLSYSTTSHSSLSMSMEPFQLQSNMKTPPKSNTTNLLETPSTAESSINSHERRRLFQDGDSMTMDSLNEFMETADPDESVQAAISSPPAERKYPIPPTYAVRSDSSTISGSAVQAAIKLKQSFFQPRRLRSDDSTMTDGNSTLSSAMRRSPPPTIREANTESSSSVEAQSVEIGLDGVAVKTATPRNQSPATVQSRHRITRSTNNARAVGMDGSIKANFSYDSKDLSLHDLCDAASSTDDQSWKKAVFLLSVEPQLAKNVEVSSKMTALHVCALGLQPPPIWMIRALLYTSPEQAQQLDTGGRLPLHLVAATSADLAMMQLLVDEYPASVGHKDERGFTPLQLLLKNDQIILTLDHLRILMGQTVSDEEEEELKKHLSFRKGEHLTQTLQDLETRKRQRQEEKHEIMFPDYPDDVRSCLKKITQWKKRQVAKGNVFNSRFFASYQFENPAGISTPTGKLLPLHLLVRRKPNVRPLKVSSRPPAVHADLARVLATAYPLALVTRDANSRTPLMTAMLQTEAYPDREVIEVLLGIGIPGFVASRMGSPAALAVDDSLQLPLHVAAEESASDYALLSAIYEAYPQAKTIQDVRGRTPLLLALRNYRSVPIDEPTLDLLFEEKVAILKDQDGKIPLDVVLENPKSLKQSQSMIIQEFLDASIGKPNNWRESQNLLGKLRDLPPWLRRHACGAHYVQEALMDEVATPWVTFWVLFNGLVLVSLLVVLRLLLDRLDDTLITVLYVLASLVMVNQVVYWTIAMLLGEFYRLCVSNPLRWIDLASGYLPIATAYLISADGATLQDELGVLSFSPAEVDPLVSTLGASATVCIWISLVGHMVQWYCGMAVFFGSAVQVLYTMFWPLIMAAMGIVGMSQVFYTLGECGDGDGCSLSEAYTTVYWMILGQPVFDNEDDRVLSDGMIAILIIFTLLWIWWIVSVVVMSVTETHQLDREQIALKWYWEPKVALTVFSRVKDGKEKQPRRESPPLIRVASNEMERTWQILASSLQGSGNQIKGGDRNWDSSLNRPGRRCTTRLLAMILLPIWFVAGFVTLGLLWPPQLRRWLFSTNIIRHQRQKQQAFEERLTAAKVSNLRSDLSAFKYLTTEQSQITQRDIQEIKDLLYLLAMGKSE